MVCVTAFAYAQQTDRRIAVTRLLEQRKTSAFADRYTVAINIERAARRSRGKPKRIEAVKRRQA
jgi:hypothetical protein